MIPLTNVTLSPSHSAPLFNSTSLFVKVNQSAENMMTTESSASKLPEGLGTTKFLRKLLESAGYLQKNELKQREKRSAGEAGDLQSSLNKHQPKTTQATPLKTTVEYDPDDEACYTETLTVGKVEGKPYSVLVLGKDYDNQKIKFLTSCGDKVYSIPASLEDMIIDGLPKPDCWKCGKWKEVT